jgi:hypothetical protein
VLLPQELPFEHGRGEEDPTGQKSPAAHASQTLVPPGLKNPALHATQTVSVTPLQIAETPCPEGHGLQGMQADLAALEISFSPQDSHFFNPPSLYSPSPHSVHFVSMPLEHIDTFCPPSAKVEHGMQVDLAAFEISLTPQALHFFKPPSLYSPLLHSMHSVSTPSEHREIYSSPAAHDEHGIQADFAAFEISFSPHAKHAPSPPSLHSSLLHSIHSVSMPSEHGDAYPSPTAHDEHGIQADFAAFEISFSPQNRHSLRPPSLYSPSPQATHSVSIPSLQGKTYPSPTA